MIRTIAAWRQDEHGDWVAELSCGHSQHVRHRPPFYDRPWVLDPSGRRERLGSEIACPLCERAEMPDGLRTVAQLGPWGQDDLPEGLRRTHLTPAGRWGRLCVLEGEAEVQLDPDADPPGRSRRLVAGEHQALPPGRPHRVRPLGRAVVRLELRAVPPRVTAGPEDRPELG